MAFISISNITKTFHTGKVSYDGLRGLNLEIKQGEFVAIMGPSGSGKSTLLNIIGGLDTPTSGEVTVGEHKLSQMNVDQLSDYRSRNVGFIFQNYELLPYATALENVTLPLVIEGQDNAQTNEYAKKLLSIIHMGDRLNNKPTELSGGEQQRVGVVRALIKEPDIVLADEPTGNLDSVTSAEVIEVIKQLSHQGKRTVVMVTHDPEIAKQADRTIKIKDGAIA